jgi:chloramphenicol 3-O-phosphotransferase
MKQKKVAILIRGASAVGKTTTTRALLKALPNFVNLHVDDYRNAVRHLDHQAQREFGYKKGIERLNELIKEEANLIIDEQFRPEFYIPVVDLLDAAGYRIINVVLQASLEIVQTRDKSRPIPIGEERLTTLHARAQTIEADLMGLKKGEDMEIDTSKHTADESVAMILSKISS